MSVTYTSLKTTGALMVDYLYRSRVTLLEILESWGYNTAPVRKFSPAEIAIATIVAEGSGKENMRTLNFEVQKAEGAEGAAGAAAGIRTCKVVYIVTPLGKSAATFEMLDHKDEENFDELKKTTEYVVMAVEPLRDAAELAAYCWGKGQRTFVFQVESIVTNPTKHVLVPKHRLVPEEDHAALLKRLYLTTKAKLPIIRMHDIQARCLGAVPGDIVEITRPSPSAGEYTLYRVCAL